MPVGDIMGLGNKPSLDVQPPILEKIIAQYHNIVGMTNRDGQKLSTYLIPNFSQGELVSLCGFGSFPATLEGSSVLRNAKVFFNADAKIFGFALGKKIERS